MAYLPEERETIIRYDELENSWYLVGIILYPNIERCKNDVLSVRKSLRRRIYHEKQIKLLGIEVLEDDD